MFRCHLLNVIFFIAWFILSFIWIILTLFNKIIWENFRTYEISFIYNFKYWPPFYCIYFVYFSDVLIISISIFIVFWYAFCFHFGSNFKSVNVFNIYAHCLFICFCGFFFFNINWNSFINICLFSYRQIVSSWIYFSQFSFYFLIALFSFK